MDWSLACTVLSCAVTTVKYKHHNQWQIAAEKLSDSIRRAFVIFLAVRIYLWTRKTEGMAKPGKMYIMLTAGEWFESPCSSTD